MWFHAFSGENQIREGFDTHVSTIHMACVDLKRHNAALTGYQSNYVDFSEHSEYTVETPCNKDLLAFCAAAFGLVDVTRRLKMKRKDVAQEIDEVIDRIFVHDSLSVFVKDLRKNLSHGSVVVPYWSIAYDGQDRQGSMLFSVERLLRFGEWSALAKKYLQEAKEGIINICDMATTYESKVQKFASAVGDILARNVTDMERDFFEIEDKHKISEASSFFNILLHQIGKGKDPYEYLHRFFNKEQIRAIHRLPMRSLEQITYIESLIKVKYGLGDSIRHDLMKYFNVYHESTVTDPS